jgi:hypothetical protein
VTKLVWAGKPGSNHSLWARDVLPAVQPSLAINRFGTVQKFSTDTMLGTDGDASKASISIRKPVPKRCFITLLKPGRTLRSLAQLPTT